MKLITNIYTPDSILNRKDQYVPITIGVRPRYATCTSVCWFDSNTIASLNLYGNKIITYAFDETTKEFSILQEVNNEQGAMLSMSEHFSISPNKTLIAVCSSPPLNKPTPKACVNIYRYDSNKKIITPTPIFHIEENHLIHNVRFTADGKYLSYVTYDDERSINMYRITDGDGGLSLEQVLSKKNSFVPQKAKAINFTKDNKFAIVAYCIGLVHHSGPVKSRLVCYKWNEDGILGDVVSIFEHTFGMEDIVFSKNDDFIYSSDQVSDYILKYSFDTNTGKINYVESYNPESNMSFPHGMSVSEDGKYIAVANYGGDRFNLCEL